MSQTLLEKLQLTDEKNLLIQGLPSSIEKQFVKLAFAKNLTPLLKSRKIDFALVFAVNEQQLQGIVREVLPALQEGAKFWVAYPKTTSKIATTLNRNCTWECITRPGYGVVREVALDHVWTAVRFKKADPVKVLERTAVKEKVLAAAGVDALIRSIDPRITSAKKEQTRSRRLELAIDKLNAGKKNPAAK